MGLEIKQRKIPHFVSQKIPFVQRFVKGKWIPLSRGNEVESGKIESIEFGKVLDEKQESRRERH